MLTQMPRLVIQKVCVRGEGCEFERDEERDTDRDGEGKTCRKRERDRDRVECVIKPRVGGMGMREMC